MMRLLAACLSLSCLGCVEGGLSGRMPIPSFAYYASDCRDLQREAARLSERATALVGSPRRAPAVDPSAMLTVVWPRVAAAASTDAPELQARMDALAATAKAKPCAIAFET